MKMIIAASLIGNLLVVMVTTAPLASVEKADNSVQEDSSVDRAKRAEEEIYFGNQQNKARAVVKKSGTDNALSLPTPEVDLGGDVVALPQVPVDQDVVDRAEAALDRGGENEKNAQAMEAAMQSAVESAIDSNGSDRSEETDIIDDIQEQGDQSESVSQSEEVNQPTSEVDQTGEESKSLESDEDDEVKELGEINEDGDNEDDDSEETADEKELQEAVLSTSSDVSSAEDSESDDTTSVQQANVEELGDVAESQESNDDDALTLQQLNNQKGNMYNSYYPTYQAPIPSDSDKPVTPPGCFFYPGMSSYWCPFAEHRNRIKRDLRDDIYPYSEYPSEYEDDSRSAYDVQSPNLSDEDLSYMYKMILNKVEENYLNKLADQYADMQEKELSYDPRYLPEEEDNSLERGSDEDMFMPTEEELSPYALRYAYEPQEVEVEPLRRRAAKRSEYYGPEDLEKRYFFPVNDEPHTHWGAFVPERKRNHDDALQRLQRLAYALGDNHGPLHRELIGEYEKRRR